MVSFQEGGTHGADEVFANGKYAVLPAPPLYNYAISGSGPSMINDKGLIVGDYSTGANSYEGFIAAPPANVPEPAAWMLMILGVGACGASVRSSRRRPAAA